MLQSCRLITCDEVKMHNSRWLLSKVANSKPTMECTPRQRVRKRYVDIFGFASAKYPNEDSQTLGNKKPSLHRKATELQPRPPRGTSGRVQAVLTDRCRIDLRSVDWKIDIMGCVNGSLNCRTRPMVNRITSCKQEERDHGHRSVEKEQLPHSQFFEDK
jgi:hypothetical protein